MAKKKKKGAPHRSKATSQSRTGTQELSQLFCLLPRATLSLSQQIPLLLFLASPKSYLPSAYTTLLKDRHASYRHLSGKANAFRDRSKKGALIMLPMFIFQRENSTLGGLKQERGRLK